MTPFRLPIDLPVLLPLPNNLVAVATVVDDPQRWEAGLKVREWPRLSDGAWLTFDPCAGATKNHARPGPFGDAPVFGVAAGVTCTTAGVVDTQAFRERAQRIYDSYEPRMVETEVASTTLASDYSLAAITSIGSAATMTAALSLLEGARSTLGTIHMHPANAVRALGEYVIERDQRGRLWTANGHPVVTGAGYPTNRAFVTGPVQLRRSPVLLVPDNIAQAMARSTNDVTFYVEREYVVAWDRSEDAKVTLT